MIWFELRRETLAFLGRAPVVHVAEADVAASRPAVWTVTRASVPLATAQVEAFELTETGDGTHVRWTLALEPRLLGRVSAPLAARTIPRLFRRATAFVVVATPVKRPRSEITQRLP